MTAIMGLLATLFSPVLLAAVLGLTALAFFFAANQICSGISAIRTPDCRNCESDVCEILLVVAMFVLAPLSLGALYWLKRRKRHP